MRERTEIACSSQKGCSCTNTFNKDKNHKNRLGKCRYSYCPTYTKEALFKPKKKGKTNEKKRP